MTLSCRIRAVDLGVCVIFALSCCLPALGQAADRLHYVVVDTGQDRCFNNTREISCPAEGGAFHGQDAQYEANPPAYKDNGDGTITDLNTGLMWQKTPDLKNKATFPKAVAGARKCTLGGHTDWRLPSIKELYSLIDFRGYSARSVAQSVPYINTDYFDFAHGNENAGERLIDAQYWSSTEYVSTTMNGNATVFGVNFADGRIKGYPKTGRGRANRQFVRYVRGNPRYGLNDFFDTGDGTVPDRATSLMGMKADSGKTMNWQQALAYAENLEHAGYSDWRLPNAKELQSIVDYSRAPTAAGRAARGPATDAVLGVTRTESWYWTGTTHCEHGMSTAAVYVCFGRAFGYMGPSGRKRKMDVHGAGAQRSDPKTGNPGNWPQGRGPQGDEIRIRNAVRCVRGGATILRTAQPRADSSSYPNNVASSTPQPSGRRAPSRGRGGFVQRLDKDSDGKVSRKEFDGPPQHFDRLDQDRDGFLSDAEAPKRPPARPRRRRR